MPPDTNPMPPPHHNPSRDIRSRILLSLSKLPDKDTHSSAVSDLLSLIPSLSPDIFPLFISSLSPSPSPSPSDRLMETVRARTSSLSLLSSLSLHHRHLLSPHLPKLTSSLLRRLRDPDSSVRLAAVSAASTFSRHSLSSPSSFLSLLRSLSDALASEQDAAAQAAAASCAAAVIDDSDSSVVDAAAVVRMVPRWVRLLRSEGFKAKFAVLNLVRSVIRVCRIGDCGLLREIVGFGGEFLKVEDWVTRKAAAELLREVAVVEREFLSQFKVSCLKLFEARKFDKVYYALLI